MTIIAKKPHSSTPESHDTKTIGKYLLDQLHERGVEHIFGLPGDYILRFDKMIEQHALKLINTTRENTAGYMADAYARLRGLGVACITYGVGINITNAIAQAYVESSPVVLISGAAGTDEFMKCHHLHHLINTSSNHLDTTQLEIFKQITAAQTVLNDSYIAATEIDRVLNTCLRLQKPVYIELPRNFIDAPIQFFHPYSLPESQGNPKIMDEIMEEVGALLKKSRRPLIWAGHEIQRFGLTKSLLQFAERHQIPIVSSLLGKTVISEQHPLFVGVYQGKMSRPEVHQYVDSCDCALILGTVLTDLETGIFTAKSKEHTVIANSQTMQIRNHHYQQFSFVEFMHRLEDLKINQKYPTDFPANANRKTPKFVPNGQQKITSDRTFECIQSHLTKEHIIVTDIGDCLFGGSDLILEQNSFLACAFFGTLGFGTPGAIAAQLASPERRVIGIIGDGAFQMTSMELSTAVRYHLDPIIIVLNNHGYGTERPLLEGSYNDILDWNYTEIPKVLGGGIGIKAKTEKEFNDALSKALSTRGTFYLIEVELDKLDFSSEMRRFIAAVGSKNKK